MHWLGWFAIAALILVGGLLALRVGLSLLLSRSAGRLRGRPIDSFDAPAANALRGRTSGLLYFFSPGCGACKSMTPQVEDLARRHPGVRAVDISRDMRSARAFGILGTPSLVVLRDGLVADVRVGPLGGAELQRLAAG
jgi:thioredoxin 1